MEDNVKVQIEEIIHYHEDGTPVYKTYEVTHFEAGVLLAKDGIEAGEYRGEIIEVLKRELFMVEQDAVEAYKQATLLAEEF